MDYLIPTACEVPRVEIEHLETPAPYIPGGYKAAGEGGAIGAPAVLANAIANALAPHRRQPNCDSDVAVGAAGQH